VGVGVGLYLGYLVGVNSIEHTVERVLETACVHCENADKILAQCQEAFIEINFFNDEVNDRILGEILTHHMEAIAILETANQV
jgi:hypothetical protein